MCPGLCAAALERVRGQTAQLLLRRLKYMEGSGEGCTRARRVRASLRAIARLRLDRGSSGLRVQAPRGRESWFALPWTLRRCCRPLSGIPFGSDQLCLITAFSQSAHVGARRELGLQLADVRCTACCVRVDEHFATRDVLMHSYQAEWVFFSCASVDPSQRLSLSCRCKTSRVDRIRVSRGRGYTMNKAGVRVEGRKTGEKEKRETLNNANS